MSSNNEYIVQIDDLAIYLMKKGFRLLRSEPSERYEDSLQYVFEDVPYIEAAVDDFNRCKDPAEWHYYRDGKGMEDLDVNNVRSILQDNHGGVVVFMYLEGVDPVWGS